MNEDWTKNQKKEGSAVGGPYLAMHLRRADFLYAHADKVPSLDAVVSQVKDLLEKHKLEKVFLATDGEQEGEEFSLDHPFSFRSAQELALWGLATATQ